MRKLANFEIKIFQIFLLAFLNISNLLYLVVEESVRELSIYVKVNEALLLNNKGSRIFELLLKGLSMIKS